MKEASQTWQTCFLFPEKNGSLFSQVKVGKCTIVATIVIGFVKFEVMKKCECLVAVRACKWLHVRVLSTDVTVEVVSRRESPLAEGTGEVFRCIRVVSFQMLPQFVFLVERLSAFAAAERSVFLVAKQVNCNLVAGRE